MPVDYSKYYMELKQEQAKKRYEEKLKMRRCLKGPLLLFREQEKHHQSDRMDGMARCYSCRSLRLLSTHCEFLYSRQLLVPIDC